jgi:hypothetical protein
MTEEEAKTKPCIGPAPHNTGAPCNPNALGHMVYACAGSACLAWRWHPDGSRDPDLPRQFPTAPLAAFEKMESGFCGLAGKP